MELAEAKKLLNQAREAYEKNDLDVAIELLNQIKNTSDDVKQIYAIAQFSLGVVFKELKRYQEAEQAYNNVSREDSAEQYAKAQVNLWSLLRHLERFDEAEEAYKNVSREDSVEQYVQAQFNLGNLLRHLERFDEAEQAYTKVQRKDGAEVYARSQFTLGNLLRHLERFDEAEQTYAKIQRKDSAELYARAQFNLGNLLGHLERLDEEKQAYIKVKRKDSAKFYAWAQWNINIITGNPKYLKNIRLEDDLETYAKAQFILGGLNKKLTYKNQYWQKIPKHSEQYKKESYQIIVFQSINDLENSSCKNKFFQLLESVSKILESLFIKSEHEQSIAHYTALNVAKLLLTSKSSTEKNLAELKSNLRLNTINLMNDPTEGLLLHQILTLDHNIHTQDLPFISCFTLHHDSLNQFRLYGKEGEQEATGLSLCCRTLFLPQNITLLVCCINMNPHKI